MTEDICPKHDKRETCVMVGHNHLLTTCYRTFKMGCGYLFAVDQPIDHCSDGAAEAHHQQRGGED